MPHSSSGFLGGFSGMPAVLVTILMSAIERTQICQGQNMILLKTFLPRGKLFESWTLKMHYLKKNLNIWKLIPPLFNGFFLLFGSLICHDLLNIEYLFKYHIAHLLSSKFHQAQLCSLKTLEFVCL